MQWMMLQQEQPEDFVIATGVQYSVRQFIEWSAQELGVILRFEGQGVDERAVVSSISGDKAPGLKPGQVIVKVDPRYFRPTEVETLLGDPAKAKAKLDWTPQITVKEMCAEMVASDLTEAQRHSLLKQHGYPFCPEASWSGWRSASWTASYSAAASRWKILACTGGSGLFGFNVQRCGFAVCHGLC